MKLASDLHPRTHSLGYQAVFFHPLTITEAQMTTEAAWRAAEAGFIARRVVATETHDLSYFAQHVATVTVVTVEVAPGSSNGNGHA